jgi:hypothetical protein
VLVFVLISMVLTFQHSNQKARNLHTSIPLVWVLAGAGSVAAAQWLLRRQGGLQAAAQWSLAAALAAPAMLVIGSPGASPESGHGQDLCSLALARHYLPWLGANASSNAILATQPMESFAEWTYLVAYPV